MPRVGDIVYRQLDAIAWLEAYTEEFFSLARREMPGDPWFVDEIRRAYYDGKLSFDDAHRWIARCWEREYDEQWYAELIDGRTRCALVEAVSSRIRQLDDQARRVADRKAITATVPSWDVLRGDVYDRDRGICWVCGLHVPWEHYNLGHIIDRVAGGLDVPENLAVMCITCNQVLKPVHDTIAEAEHWRRHHNPWDRIVWDFVREIAGRPNATAGTDD